MKIKSVSGIVCYVKNLKKTVAFYEKLGFVIKNKDQSHVKIYSNWFWIDLLPISKEKKTEFQKEAHAAHKGAGLYVYLSVDNVDEFYTELLKKGMKPSSKPRDWSWGNREFVLRDPDGYKLIFFQKN